MHLSWQIIYTKIKVLTADWAWEPILRMGISEFRFTELSRCEQTNHPITIAVVGTYVTSSRQQQQQWLTSSSPMPLSTNHYWTNQMQMISETTYGQVAPISWTTRRSVPPCNSASGTGRVSSILRGETLRLLSEFFVNLFSSNLSHGWF